MPQLFFNSSDGQNYGLIDEIPECGKCLKEFNPDEMVVYRKSWLGTKLYEEKVLCRNCIKRGIPQLEYETRAVHLVEILLDGCTVVAKFKFALSPAKDMSVFTAADTHEEGVLVQNHTKLSGRESWEGLQIGKAPDEAIEEKQSKQKQIEADR